MADRDGDFQLLRRLHRQVLAPLVRRCLDRPGVDPDLRRFAAGLPAAVDSVEAHLKNFWQRQNYGPAQVQDFARRYGLALAARAEFRAFEEAMEELGRLAGTPGFGPRLAAAAGTLGADPEDLGADPEDLGAGPGDADGGPGDPG